MEQRSWSMVMQRVTFNVGNDFAAQTLQRKLTLSGIRLRALAGAAEFGNNPVGVRQPEQNLQGFTMEIPASMVPAARQVIYELFINNRYYIHSVTIDGRTCLADEVTGLWWNECFNVPSIMNQFLAESLG
jgi:uncharacterized protein (DUF608 family)